jgi:PAS domain S-box-containing protein
MVHPNGELRTILNRKGPLVSVDGKAGGIVGIFVDITENRKAEERLRESENKFRKLTEKSSFGIFLTQKGFYRYLNNRFAEIFGYQPEELINRRCLPELVHPDDWPVMEEIIRQRKTDPRPSHNYQIRGITKDRRTVYLDVYSSRMVYQGQPSTIGSIIDCTDRFESEKALKQAEEKYRGIFENIMVGIFQSTPEGRLISANPASATILGYSSPQELIDSISIIKSLYVDAEDRRRVLSHLAEQDVLEDFETHLFRKDRSHAWVSLNIRTVRDPEGRIRYYEGIVENITEKRALEKQLAQAQKMEAIGTLAGGIAHDFNNLLMGIQGYSTLLLHELKPEHPLFDKVLNIEKLAQSGADLTKQLLGFARGGKAELTCIDLNEVVDKTSSMFGRTKKEISIHLNCQEGLQTIDADRGQIEQVLLNLYVNAWQAMPEGGDLYLETKNITLDEFYIKPFTVTPGDYVQISVTDTGIGMDQKTKARIFEPFFTTKEMGRGTGLGLATVYGIIKNHGGFVNVYSEIGQGSTFNLYFPASAGEVVREKSRPAEILSGVGTVLLIDDEETVLAVTKEMLMLMGFSVLVARSGKEGMTLYQKYGPEIVLVILDMIMPDMGGRETLENLLAIDPNARVILSSGYCLNDQAVTLLDQGCRAFLQKPFSLDVLSAKIREGLEKIPSPPSL